MNIPMTLILLHYWSQQLNWFVLRTRKCGVIQPAAATVSPNLTRALCVSNGPHASDHDCWQWPLDVCASEEQTYNNSKHSTADAACNNTDIMEPLDLSCSERQSSEGENSIDKPWNLSLPKREVEQSYSSLPPSSLDTCRLSPSDRVYTMIPSSSGDSGDGCFGLSSCINLKRWWWDFQK